MTTEFIHLNPNWNAEPNDPDEKISLKNAILTLQFSVNPWAYKGYTEGELASLVFNDVSRYRHGNPNDEGWYGGHCRFSKLAPNWGEFYQVVGNAMLEVSPDDWIMLNEHETQNHYLFYLRDSTFECRARSYTYGKTGNPRPQSD